MKGIQTILDGVIEIIQDRHYDDRGSFSEIFRDDWFRKNIADCGFVQENQSFTQAAGVIRGLHFQSAPSAQAKLVRCLSGSIFDVAVDIRHGSPTFGHWVSVILSAPQGNQLWIPPGFLHGFCTLEPDCVVAYKVTAYYDPDCEKGVIWNDPAIGIEWPIVADPARLSPKDSLQPLLVELPDFFHFEA